jgi:hypothetical protein
MRLAKPTMSKVHYPFAALLILTQCSACLGVEDTNAIAIGAWSQPVETSAMGHAGSCAMSGRLLILEGRSSAYTGKLPETQVYLELRNASSGAGGAIDFYFDPRDGVRAALRDTNGQPPPPVGTGGSGAFPGPCWMTLPYDATVKLRCSWLGYGMAKTAGLKIPLFEELILRADNTNDYYLAVTFTAPPPTNHVVEPGHTVWQGTLALPKVNVSGRRP